ncbi:uncharacterized protein LOC116848022 [Odontomachus brunneus]|uniref:uncharacterized protein LOC116848022 n=1 Tax=Odontomachus brunneus TaxID=486640 RepID=UPI0013F27138|nr:uncharacterized protein LOC116848022 [Odontomachus brunneus]
MSENAFSENSFRDYYKAENSDDEENNNDLANRLYAEIYYPSNNEIELGANVSSNAVPLFSCIIKESINGQEGIKYNFNDKVIPEPKVTRGQEEPAAEKIIRTNKRNLAEQETNNIAEVRKNEEISPKKHKSAKQPKIKHRKRSYKESFVSVDESEIDTKYSIVQKKMKPEIQSRNAQEGTSEESDSESILEVPVSPKPMPLLINLQDSDDEGTESSIDEDDLLEGRLRGKNASKDNLRIVDLTASSSSEEDIIEVSLDHQDIIAESTIDEDEFYENLQKYRTLRRGAWSINEIKELYKSAVQDRIETSVEGTSSKKSLSQDKSKTNNPDDLCASLELCQTSQEQEIGIGEQTQETQQNVCNVLQTGETDETKNTRMTLVYDIRYAMRTLENTLLEVSCGTNNNLVMSQKRPSESKNNGGGEEGDGSRGTKNNSSARKQQCIIQQNNQLNVIPLAQSSVQEKRNSSFWDDYFFAPLPKSLKKFYNDPRGQENFNIEEIQRAMPKDPRRWVVLADDMIGLIPARRPRRYWYSVECSYCYRIGHSYQYCPELKKNTCCRMCGRRGHIMWHCPQKICLTCGKKQKSFIHNCEHCRTLYCTMCSSVGHKKEHCPDLWRRYHSITREIDGVPRNPGNTMKPASQLHCCNCSKRGHESSMCKEYQSTHFLTPAFVTNYTEGPVYELRNVPERISKNTKDPYVPSFKSKNNKTPQQMQENTPAMQTTPLPPDTSSSSKIHITAKTGEQYAQSTQKQVVLSRFTKLKFVNVIYCCGNFRSKKNARMLVTNLSQLNELNPEAKQFLQNRFSYGISRPIFLRKLRKIIEFEITIGLLAGKKSEIIVQLIAPENCIYMLLDLLLYWLNLPFIEKKSGLDINLPMNANQMRDFLKALNLHGTSTEIKHPFKLYNVMNSLTNKLGNTYIKNKEYFYNLINLWDIQKKLLKYIHTHPLHSFHYSKLCRYMNTLDERFPSNKQLDTFAYLDILISYNNVFTPHTPPNLLSILKDMKLPRIEKQSLIQDQEFLSTHKPNSDVNSWVPFTTSSSCTLQEIDTVANPFAFTFVPNVPDNMSNVIDIANVNICQPGTNNTIENQHSKDILPLDVEPVSSQLRNSQKKNSQWSIVNVNINTNLPVTEPNVSVTGASNQSKKLSAKAKRKLARQKHKQSKEVLRQEAEKLTRQARAYQLPYMVKVAEDLLMKCKNKTLKKKDVRKVKKMMEMEDKHRKIIKQFCSHLN